jgi:membrane protein DedA with SNARE-associated domain
VSLAAETVLSLLGAHPYLLLFPLVVLEGPLVTLCAGFLVAAGVISWPFAYALAVMADLTGDTLYYILGRFGHHPRIRGCLARLGLTQGRLARLEETLTENLAKGLIGAKIADFTAIPVLVAAGLSRIGYGRFLAWNLAATLPKSALLMAVGFFSGQQAIRYVEDFGPMVPLALIFVALTVYLAVSQWTRHNSKEDSDEDTDR